MRLRRLRLWGHDEDGGPEEIRTPDLQSAILALSQLSYRPTLTRQRLYWDADASVKALSKRSPHGLFRSIPRASVIQTSSV